MNVHLVDGTYELFRFHYAKGNRDGRHGAQRGVLNTVLDLVAAGATHIGIATDHVVESFRNDLYDGYKDGSGIEPDLWAQFPEVEELLGLAGFTVWPQITHEADDALAAGLFGDAPVSQELRRRLGDILVFPHLGHFVWWREPGIIENFFHGHHGGLTAEEAITVAGVLGG